MRGESIYLSRKSNFSKYMTSPIKKPKSIPKGSSFALKKLKSFNKTIVEDEGENASEETPQGDKEFDLDEYK